jgi:hypothetical protein
MATVLFEEFATPFTLFDPANGGLVYDIHPESGAPVGLEVDCAFVRDLATSDSPRVLPLSASRYRLALTLYSGRAPLFLAVGELSSMGDLPEGSRQREQTMLLGWVRSVSEHLRLTDLLRSKRRAEATQAGQTTPWEALLAVDQVARGLRLHRERTRSQEQILDAAVGLLPVQEIAWVPLQSDEPVISRGAAELTPQDYRDLAETLAGRPELRPPAPLLCNQVNSTPWGARFPRVESLIAFLVVDQSPLGWLLALNKTDGNPFRRSDAAILLPFAALLELQLRSSSRYHDLKDLLVGLTRALTTALDAKDAFTYGHSERVARIAVELGRELGMEDKELGDIYLAGLLHDVGKIGIKDTVLQKAGRLNDEERDHIQQHVTIGYWVLAELRQIRSLLPGVLHHHERVDGKGYPDGLVGEAIPLLARVLAVADAYDAMSNQRPYREAIPYRRVEEILIEGAGSQWDKKVVDAFMRCRHRIHAIRQRGVGDSLVQAIDGALRSGTAPLRPLNELSPVNSAAAASE